MAAKSDPKLQGHSIPRVRYPGVSLHSIKTGRNQRTSIQNWQGQRGPRPLLQRLMFNIITVLLFESSLFLKRIPEGGKKQAHNKMMI